MGNLIFLIIIILFLVLPKKHSKKDEKKAGINNQKKPQANNWTLNKNPAGNYNTSNINATKVANAGYRSGGSYKANAGYKSGSDYKPASASSYDSAVRQPDKGVKPYTEKSVSYNSANHYGIPEDSIHAEAHETHQHNDKNILCRANEDNERFKKDLVQENDGYLDEVYNLMIKGYDYPRYDQVPEFKMADAMPEYNLHI